MKQYEPLDHDEDEDPLETIYFGGDGGEIGPGELLDEIRRVVDKPRKIHDPLDDYLSSQEADEMLRKEEAARKSRQGEIEMSKPWDHAVSSAKIFGGSPDDYLKIHEKMDCSKGEIGDLRHRALTHHPFFIRECIIPLFGSTIRLPDGKVISVMNVCEQHLIEDFNDRGEAKGFIPVASDYLSRMEFTAWMNSGEGGDVPSSQDGRRNSAREAFNRRTQNQGLDRPMRFD